jgi:hypothetical protein
MSDIEFNPKVPSHDAAAEAAGERARDDEKKLAQKAAGFQQAMQRVGTTPGSLPAPPMGAAQQAQKQANLTATAGTSANVATAAVLQHTDAQAGKAGAPDAGAGTAGMKTLAGGAAGTGAAAGGGASVGGESADGLGAALGGAGGEASLIESPISQQRQAGSDSGGRDGGARDQHNPSSNTHKPDVLREKAAAKDSPTSRYEKPTLRIDLASIAPSFPMPVPSGQAAAAMPQARPVFNAELVQQMVEYAMVTQNSQGQAEFHMGLTGPALNGIGVHLTACGRRRVRIRFTGVGDSDAIGESEVSQLIESLRGRNVEVAEVVME